MSRGADGSMTRTTEKAPLPADGPELHGLLANPLRHEIAMRAASRPYCATELQKLTGRSRKSVSKAITELKGAGVLELVEKRSGTKGSWSYFYRATRTVIDVEEWEQLSDSERQRESAGSVLSHPVSHDCPHGRRRIYARRQPIAVSGEP